MTIIVLRPTAFLVAGAALLATVLLTSCGSPAPAGAPTVAGGTPPGLPAVVLREIDFSAPPFATDLSARAGGGDVPQERVRYVDLTRDGVEEAVAVVESGGTLGDIGVGVFRAIGPGVDLVYFRKLTGKVDIRDGKLVITEGAPVSGDPACCPTQVRETDIEWRNGNFEVTAERVVATPIGGEYGY